MNITVCILKIRVYIYLVFKLKNKFLLIEINIYYNKMHRSLFILKAFCVCGVCIVSQSLLWYNACIYIFNKLIK